MTIVVQHRCQTEIKVHKIDDNRREAHYITCHWIAIFAILLVWSDLSLFSVSLSFWDSPSFLRLLTFYRMILVVLQTSTSTSALLFFAMAALFFMFKGRDNYLMISDCKYINQSSMINYQYGHPFYNHIGNLRVMNDINHYTNMRTDCVYTLFHKETQSIFTLRLYCSLYANC